MEIGDGVGTRDQYLGLTWQQTDPVSGVCSKPAAPAVLCWHDWHDWHEDTVWSTVCKRCGGRRLS